MKKVLTIETISFCSFILMVLFNIIDCVIPLNGKLTNIELTESYPNLFNPAAYTYLIWIFIVLLITLISLYLIIARYRNKRSLYPNKYYIAFIILCMTDIVWNVAWSFNYLALSVMLSITGVIILCRMNVILANGESRVIHYTFQLCLGWLLIISASYIMPLLSSIRWMEGLLSEVICTLSLVIILTVISIYLSLRYHYIFSGFSVIWAFIGMLVRHIQNTDLNTQFPQIIFSIISGIVILVGLSMTEFFIFLKHRHD